ncbi:PIN domain-containing protein [Candidatus Woesearchaeota archaeon]|nr:PIN domain-containing protein [Candidatus Woesearchaeota archaeon]
MQKYYLDACIWIDYFENRKDRFRPLGEWALDLIKKIIEDDALILYSELVEEELSTRYSPREISAILNIVPSEKLVKAEISDGQIRESMHISKQSNIPKKDALHAILARDNNAVLVTRDKHFQELQKSNIIKKPEEINLD